MQRIFHMTVLTPQKKNLVYTSFFPLFHSHSHYLFNYLIIYNNVLLFPFSLSLCIISVKSI